MTVLPFEQRAYSPAQVADLWGVSVRTIERLLERGDLFYVQVQSRRRVPSWAVDDYLHGGAA